MDFITNSKYGWRFTTIWRYCFTGGTLTTKPFQAFTGMHVSMALGPHVMTFCAIVESSGWYEEAMLTIW
jgi:hypothetical protein